MPNAGGLLDQDPYWIEVFKLVVEAESAAENVAKQRAEQEKQRQERQPRVK